MFMLFDIHSHLIPGIDDGADDFNTSLTALRVMESCNVENLILTPHYSERRGYVPSYDAISDAFEKFKNDCAKAGIKINFYLGSEIEYSSDIVNMLKSGKIHTLAGTKYVLTEFAPYSTFNDIVTAVQSIIQIGYIPILAHIERYAPIIGNFRNILYIKHFGALTQINIDSVILKNFRMRRLIKKALKKQLIDFVAGDVHDTSYTPEHIMQCKKIIESCCSKEYTDKIMYINAKEIFTFGGE